MHSNDTNTRTLAHNENTPTTGADNSEFIQQFAALTPKNQTIIGHTIKAAVANDTQMLKGLKLCLPEHSHDTMNDLIRMCGGEA